MEVSLGLCALGGLAITEIASAVTNKTDRVFATLNSSISHCAMKKVQINEINIRMRLGYIEIDGSYIFVFHLVLIFVCLKKKKKEYLSKIYHEFTSRGQWGKMCHFFLSVSIGR